MQIKTEKAQRWLFLAAFFLGFWRMSALMMGQSGMQPLTMDDCYWMNYIVLGLALCAILLRGWNIFDLVLCAFSACTYSWAEFNEFSIMVLLLVVARGLDQRWLVQIWFGMHLVLVCLCAVFYPMLYLQGSPHATVTMGNGFERYNFFFNHCNGFGLTVAFCALAFAFLYYEKVHYVWTNLALLGSAALCWFGPKCKTAALILILCTSLLAMYRFLPKLFRVVMWVGVPGVLILAFGLVLGYYWGLIPPNQWILSAGTFSARFVDAAVALKLYSPTLFGQGIYNIEQYVEVAQFAKTTCFDFGMLRIFVRFGIFGGTVFYGTVFATMYRVLKRREWLKALMIFLMMTYCTMEWIPFTTMFPLMFANNVFDFKKKRFLRFGRYGVRARSGASAEVTER